MQAPKLRPAPRQVLSEKHEVLTEVLHDGVNLAVWQRRLAGVWGAVEPKTNVRLS